MATTKITEVGLRETIKRLIATTQCPLCNDCHLGRRRSEEAHLFREDGRFLCLYVIRHISATSNLYEVVVSWHDVDGVEEDASEISPFLNAMDRFMGSNASETLAYVNERGITELGGNHQKDRIPCILNALHRALHAQLCPCERNMIADDGMVCFTCSLSLTEEDVAMHLCGVCKDCCMAPIRKTPCCEQYIHKACYDKCHPKVCPFCREPLP